MGLKLQYLTGSRADLKDLQKVFICAAGKDLDKYFETIKDDLFKAQSNISVWYPVKDEETPDNEEAYRFLLADMNLFVIPVTEAFLNEESRARSMEMPFAQGHGIPVLPILFERVPKSRFSEVCGKLHVLDKNDPDPTALPYEDKLKMFLDTVLLKDEMIEKIRQAFAAYIFLSYRKKDRKYAQEVMRLIHKSPFARDIAIWYDEYLTPGEDFNESIRHAFEKSDLFALVVTPNLLEQANYVMRVEYPMANETGKKILPIMSVETDGDELKRCYPGIPEALSSDEKNLDYIDQLIRESLTIHQDDSPEHKYIMGLAYLSGIDVETDHERALSLITDAAESDLDEAMLKLVSMYENGQGVKRSYYYGAVWHKKYVELLEKRLADGDGDNDSRAELIKEINKDILKWHNIYNNAKAWYMCLKVQRLKIDKPTVSENLALLENKILSSQICMDNKNESSNYIIEPFTRSAEKCIDSICNEMNKNGEENNACEFRLFYSVQIELLRAQYKRFKHEWFEAIKQYKDIVFRLEECLLTRDKIFVKKSKYSLVICYGELADCIYHQNGDSCVNSDEVREFAKKAIDLAEEYEEEGISFTEKETMIPKFILIHGMIEEGELDEASKMLSDFISLCEKRKEDEESVDSLQLLTQAHNLYSNIENIKGNLSEEAKHLKAEVDLLSKLSTIIGNHNVCSRMIEDYKRLIDIALELRGDHKEYLKCLYRLGIWHYRNDKEYFNSLAAIARRCNDPDMFQTISKQLIEISKNNNPA